MAVYHYQAYNNDGEKINGTLTADSEKKTRQQLIEKGLIPIRVESGLKQEKSLNKTALFSRIKKADVTLALRELAALVGAGLPVEEALATLAKQTEKQALATIILDVQSRVREGFSLARSLEAHSDTFPPIITATIAAGEESGHLAQVLEHLAEYSERQEQMRSKVKQALLYPFLMTTVALAIISFLIIWIVPTLIGVFQEQGTTLPLLTRVLIAVSDFLREFGVLMLFMLLLGGWAFKHSLQYEHMRLRYHHFLLSLPLIRRTLITTNTARFARTLSILLRAGVPMLHAVKISSQLITLLPLKNKIHHVIERLSEGESLHRALEKTGYFAPLMLHFVANGEATGKLDDMLHRAGVHQEHKVILLIESLLTLFEPLLILLMGGIVLFIVLAVLIPMFQVTQMVA